MTKCICNVCLLPMETDRYIQGRNFCSADCRRVGAIKLDRPMKHYVHYVCSTNSLVDQTSWPTPGTRKQSYHPSHTLRLRDKSLRATTKTPTR